MHECRALHKLHRSCCQWTQRCVRGEELLKLVEMASQPASVGTEAVHSKSNLVYMSHV